MLADPPFVKIIEAQSSSVQDTWLVQMEDNKPRMKMDQDLPLSPARQKTSLMPKVSLSPATTDMENTRVKFKWFSAKSLVHCLCNFGPFAGANLVGYLTGSNDQLSVLNPPKSQNIIDTGSEVASFAVAVSVSVFPLPLCLWNPLLLWTCPHWGFGQSQIWQGFYLWKAPVMGIRPTSRYGQKRLI